MIEGAMGLRSRQIRSVNLFTPKSWARFVAQELRPDPPKLFISYAREDVELVDRYVKHLRLSGCKIWQDHQSIEIGRDWDSEISDAIKNATHVLYFHSQDAISSRNVADELGYARELQIPIVPIVLESAPLPFRIQRSHGLLQWEYVSVGQLCSKLTGLLANARSRRQQWYR